MEFETTAVGMALAKVAELIKVLRDEKRTQQELKIINAFESANLDAKKNAFDLYIENTELKSQKAKMESDHANAVSRLQQSHAAEIAALKKPKTGIKCEGCGDMTAQFVCIRPSSMRDCAFLGLKESHYKCNECGAEFDKQINP